MQCIDACLYRHILSRSLSSVTPVNPCLGFYELQDRLVHSVLLSKLVKVHFSVLIQIFYKLNSLHSESVVNVNEVLQYMLLNNLVNRLVT